VHLKKMLRHFRCPKLVQDTQFWRTNFSPLAGAPIRQLLTEEGLYIPPY